MINKYVLNPVFKKLKADSIYNKILDIKVEDKTF